MNATAKIHPAERREMLAALAEKDARIRQLVAEVDRARSKSEASTEVRVPRPRASVLRVSAAVSVLVSSELPGFDPVPPHTETNENFYRSQVEFLEKEIEFRKSQNQAADQSVLKLINTINNLEQQISSQKQAYEHTLLNKDHDVASKLEKLERTLSEKLKKSEESAKAGVSKCEEFKKQISLSEQNMKNLKNMLSAEKSKNDKLAEDLEKCRIKCSEQAQDMHKMRDTHFNTPKPSSSDSVTREVILSSNKDQIDSLQNQIRFLEAQLQENKAFSQNLMVQTQADKESILHTHSEAIKTLHEEKNSKNKLIKELKLESNSLQEVIAEKSGLVSSLKTKVKALMKENTHTHKAVKGWQSKYKSADKGLSSERQLNVHVCNQLQVIQRECDIHNKNILLLVSKKLQHVHSDMGHLRKTVGSLLKGVTKQRGMNRNFMHSIAPAWKILKTQHMQYKSRHNLQMLCLKLKSTLVRRLRIKFNRWNTNAHSISASQYALTVQIENNNMEIEDNDVTVRRIMQLELVNHGQIQRELVSKFSILGAKYRELIYQAFEALDPSRHQVDRNELWSQISGVLEFKLNSFLAELFARLNKYKESIKLRSKKEIDDLKIQMRRNFLEELNLSTAEAIARRLFEERELFSAELDSRVENERNIMFQKLKSKEMEMRRISLLNGSIRFSYERKAIHRRLLKLINMCQMIDRQNLELHSHLTRNSEELESSLGIIEVQIAETRRIQKAIGGFVTEQFMVLLDSYNKVRGRLKTSEDENIVAKALESQKKALEHGFAIEKICLEKRYRYLSREQEKSLKDRFHLQLKAQKDKEIHLRVDALKANTENWQRVIQELEATSRKSVESLVLKFVEEKKQLVLQLNVLAEKDIKQRENILSEKEKKSLLVLESKLTKQHKQDLQRLREQESNRREKELKKLQNTIDKIVNQVKTDEQKNYANKLKLFQAKSFEKLQNVAQSILCDVRNLVKVVSVEFRTLLKDLSRECFQVFAQALQKIIDLSTVSSNAVFQLSDLSVTRYIQDQAVVSNNRYLQYQALLRENAYMAAEEILIHTLRVQVARMSETSLLTQNQSLESSLEIETSRNAKLDSILKKRLQRRNAEHFAYFIYRVKIIRCVIKLRKSLSGDYAREREKLLLNQSFFAKKLNSSLSAEKNAKVRLESMVQELLNTVVSFKKKELITCKAKIHLFYDELKSLNHKLTAYHLSNDEIQERSRELKLKMQGVQQELQIINESTPDQSILVKKKELDRKFEQVVVEGANVNRKKASMTHQIRKLSELCSKKTNELKRAEKQLSSILIQQQSAIFSILNYGN